MPIDPKTPHNDLPLLPPRGRLETAAVLRKCIAARASLAELKQAGRRLPDQSVLINTIPLLEARASSEIENIVTTGDALFYGDALGENDANPAVKEALRYRTALRRGFDSVSGGRPLSKATATEVCGAIKGREMAVRRIPGTRLIGGGGEAVYTPPEGEARLLDLLDNWERFLYAENTCDPLVRMAIAHYQFEAIHPFADGNGRTGRILNILYLIERRLLDIPVLYLSRYILARRGDYYRLLSEVTGRGAWRPWILFMLAAVEETARWTVARIDAVAALREHTAAYLQSRAHSPLSADSIAKCIFRQPYCRIRDFMATLGCTRITATNHLRALCDAGVMGEKKIGREILFVHQKYLRLMLQEDNHDFARY